MCDRAPAWGRAACRGKVPGRTGNERATPGSHLLPHWEMIVVRGVPRRTVVLYLHCTLPLYSLSVSFLSFIGLRVVADRD